MMKTIFELVKVRKSVCKYVLLLCISIIVLEAKSQVSVTLTPFNPNTNNTIVDMYFSNNSIGFYLSDIGEVFQTTDGGENWNMIHVDSLITTNSDYSGQEVTSIVSTPDSVFIFSNSSDFNDKWCVKIKSSISNINFTKDTVNYWVKFPEYWNNGIWDRKRVSDSIALHYPQFTGVYELQIADNRISGSTNTKIYFSNDYGISWEEREFTTSPLSSEPYQSFYYGDTLYAITNYATNVYKSFDEGITWNVNSQPTAYFKLFKNYLIGHGIWSSNKIYVCDLEGNILFQDTVLKPIINMYMKTENEGFFMGEGMLVKFDTNISLNTKEEGLKKNISIYPNPAKHLLQVKVSENLKIKTIQLFSITGQRIKNYKPTERQLNISNISLGVYCLKFVTDDGIITKKVVIE